MGVYPEGGAHRSAVISDDGVYRYRLTRYWQFDKPTLGWIMLNPSTADGEEDDPTIRRCVGFARQFGYGGIMVCNLFAYRATNPRELARAEDPVGPENDQYLALMFAMAAAHRTGVMAGWGAQEGIERRVKEVLTLPLAEERLYCLGKTQGGHPRHPLYVKSDIEIERYVP